MPLLRHLLALCMLLLVSACVSPPDFPTEGDLQAEYRGLFILSEGQWNLSNATLDYYNPHQDYARTSELFFRVNNIRLGDVANDAVQDEDTLYIVMNNSQLIYKVQLPSLQLIAQLQLPAPASPRTLVKVAPDKAYVNSLLGGQLYVINPQSMTLRYTLPLEDHAEGMLYAGGKVFVTIGNYPGKTNNLLAAIDPETDAITYHALPIENPGPLVQLADGRIAVGCRGNYVNTNSAIVLVNPETSTLLDTIYVQGAIYGMAAMPDQVLFTSDSAISRLHLPTRALTYNWLTHAQLGARDTDLLYALHWDDTSQRLFLTNAGYGAQNGRCYVLDTLRNISHTLHTGVFPGTIFWVR